MRLTLLSLASALLALLSACSSADILNATVSNSGYTIKKDIAYGTLPRHTLDIYSPSKPDPSRAVIVFFYGGSWQMGDKSIYKFVGQALASRGYTVVIPDYRLYPEIHYPAFLEDSAQAVAWTHKHIGEYNANPDNIFLAGHSAGAYNAIMLALNNTYLKAEGYDASQLRGAIGLAGPYDFLPFTDPKIIEIFSTAPDNATQPITYAGANKPPLLLLHGDADDEVAIKNSRNLAAKQEEYGSTVAFNTYPNVGHYGIILSLSQLFRSKDPALDDMDSFIHTHTAP